MCLAGLVSLSMENMPFKKTGIKKEETYQRTYNGTDQYNHSKKEPTDAADDILPKLVDNYGCKFQDLSFEKAGLNGPEVNEKSVINDQDMIIASVSEDVPQISENKKELTIGTGMWIIILFSTKDFFCLEPKYFKFERSIFFHFTFY